MCRTVCGFLIAWLVPLGLVAGVQAQPDDPAGPGEAFGERWVESPFHAEVPLERARLAAFLQNVDREESKVRLKGLLQQFLANPESLRNPIAAWGQNPELQKEMQRFLGGDQALRPDHPLFKQALEILQNNPGAFNGAGLEGGSARRLNPENLGLQRDLARAAQEYLQNRRRQPPPEVNPAQSPFADMPRPPQGDRGQPSRGSGTRDPEHWLEQWLIRQVKRIDTNHEIFRSPAVQDMFKDVSRLTRTDRADHLPQSAALGNVGRSVVDLAKRLKLDQALSRLRLPPLRNFHMPAAQGWHLPRVRLPSVSLGGPGGSGLGGSSGSSSRSSAATLVLAAILAGLIWYALAKYRRTHTKATPALALPAEWPVPPGSVATREDVIRAFEYLSLMQLGREARTQHHHALAEGLGGSEAGRRQAALQLAELYEQARYAPGDEPLTAPDLSAARQSLSFLAGKALA